MKTFYFNPDNYGSTFVVMAKTYEEALQYVTKYCKDKDELDSLEHCLTLDPPYIELKEGEVFESCNC